jgi:hypothetical protein
MMTADVRRQGLLHRFSRQWFAASAIGLSVVFLVAVAIGTGQTSQQGEGETRGLSNGGFEEVDAAGMPTGWFLPPTLKAAGYQVAIDSTKPLAGKNSALVDSTGVREIGNTFGNLAQSIDAKPYRGKRLRFRAAVRTAELQGDGRAQLWFRVDGAPSPDGRPAIVAFDNMSDRPIRDNEWKHYEIVHQIGNDAARMTVGLLLLRTGKAWIDDATLEVVPDSTPTTGAKMATSNRPTATAKTPSPKHEKSNSPTQPKPETRPSGTQSVSNLPDQWIAFASRESKDRPTLVVTSESGEAKTHAVVADAVIISYLADRAWGHLLTHSISVSDTLRALIRFDPVSGVGVRRAELVLKFGQSQMLPRQPFEIGIHEVTAEWDENTVTWANQPKVVDEPVAKASLDPKASEFRVDVTALLKRGGEQDAPKYGWLLKVTSPIKSASSIMVANPIRIDPTPGDGRGPESDLLALFPWAESPGAARALAQTENKLVLACVRAQFDDRTNFSEQMLLTAGLADPDVRALVAARFVPVRVRYQAQMYVLVHLGQRVPFDPLGELGATLKDSKAPALVVATADGKLVATLASIGTFDRDLFLRFLLGAVAKAGGSGEEKDAGKLLARGELDAAGKAFAGIDNREGRYGQARVASLRGDHQAALDLCLPLARADGAYRHEATVQAAHALVRLGRFGEAEPLLREVAGSDGSRAAEAAYLLGCVLHRSGDRAKAAETWRDVVTKHATSPDAIRAQARLKWPEATASYESLTAGNVPADLARTEVDRSREEDQAVRRGVEYLLANQAPNGSWATPTHAEIYRVAITSLAARAVHRWSEKLAGDLGREARAASEKATGWLNQEVARANPETCNSFGAAYLLDYFVDLEETKAAVRGDTNKAVALLLGGQCPNGAWSYDLRFDKIWTGGFGGWPVTDQGRTHSINTGPALLALARAKDAGFAVDAKALEAGLAVLLKMRGVPGVYTYTYPVPENFKSADLCLGRGCVCEHALRRLGAVSADDLGVPIARFMKDREELRVAVKLSVGWLPPRAVSSYFYFYAYDHAARAIADHGERVAERLAILRDDILKVVEADGTWVDCETYGKPYGTAMALHILHLAREATEQAKVKP